MPFKFGPTFSLPAYTLIFVLALSGIASEQKQSDSPGQGLYLLAATPTQNVNYGTNRYPTTLYRANTAKKLEVVREITSEKDGSAAVQSAGDVIFVLDNLNFTVHIIHTKDPVKPDSLTFNADRRGAAVDLQAGVTPVTPAGSVPHLLLPMVIPQSNKEEDEREIPSPPAWTLVSVSGDATQDAGRIQFDQWNEYAAMRFEGTPGIPILSLWPGVWIDGDTLTFRNFANPPRSVVVDKAPRSLPTNRRFDVEAVDDHYLVMRNPPYLPESGTLLRDRSRDSWKKIAIEGDQSRLRLFGQWLATDVEMESSGPFADDKPEKSGERDSRTSRLPSVYGEYSSYCFMNHRSFPGILVLQNLGDGRTIRMETHQEDSEILWVGGDVVLYRINDEIYRAEIIGSQLRNATLIVKDDDVPEVHWVFFSE